MGVFHLDADWDRDGKITPTRAERSARTAPPGLILLANLDVDARRLPTSVNRRAPRLQTPSKLRYPRATTMREPCGWWPRQPRPAGRSPCRY